MSATMLKLRPGCAPLTDVPGVLRRIADDLEREIEDYGPDCVCRVAMVVRFSGDEPRVHAIGNVENIAQAYMDLHAGAQQLLNMGRPER